MNLNKILIVLIGLILFVAALTGSGSGNYTEKYTIYIFAGVALWLFVTLLRRA